MVKRKSSHKEKLSSDAKIIVALMRKQPQTRNELVKSVGINLTTFYRVIPLLKSRGIIKETEGGEYALWTYTELERAIEDVLDKLDGNSITFNKLASEVGADPSTIEKMIYPIVKKRGLEVRFEKGEKVVAQAIEGTVIILSKS